jgi:serine/threonine protein kinase
VIPAPDIPGHNVTGVLGSGGFATVYRTWQVAVGRETAVKVDSRVLHTERDQRRFFREVTAAGQLSGHPHVVNVYDAGTLRDGRPYMVMELCPGGSLNDELRRSGPMSAERACRIGTDLADALAAAHTAGILHRDIKPANIMINRYGVIGISDFGLASIITANGEQSVSRDALTPAYAPPESFEGAEPTAAADLYSLAATIYALMAGRPPRFPADGRQPSAAAIYFLHSQPVEDIPGVPPRMLAILRQCLAADPAQRLPSAAALRDELAAFLGQPDRSPARTGPHRPASPPSTVMPPNRATPTGQDVPAAWSLSSSGGPLADAGPFTGSVRQASEASRPPSGISWTGGASGASGDGVSSGAGTWVPDQGANVVTQSRRWRPAALAAAAGGGLVLVVIAGLIVGHRLLSPVGAPATTGATGRTSATTGATGAAGRTSASATTGATGNAIDTFGVATTTSHCPAAAVAGAGARCAASPECWDGLDENEGVITASPLPCTGQHTWQTFAIGIMPSDVSTFNVNIVQANPTVSAVCSTRVMLSSRVGKALAIPQSQWSIQVVPPDEAAFDSGVRTYRCMAAIGYGESQTSQFGT